MPPDWLLVDGSSLIFRAFFGVPAGKPSPAGFAVNAVRGFIDSLARLITERRPRHVAVAGDDAWRPAWRVELIPEYKSHRTAEPVPPGLEPQIPLIQSVLEAIGVDWGGAADNEAEDVIATWAAQARGRVQIVSGDRDLFALIEDPRVLILYPEKAGLAVVDEAEVSRRYGVPGRRYADFAVLRGDPSDGLPGLKGVGQATAAQLIRKHGDIAGVLRDGGLSERDRDYVERAIRVVHQVDDLPIELPQGRRDAYPVDPGAMAKLADHHGLQNPCDRLVGALSLPR